MPDPLSIETWRNMFRRHGQKFGWALAAVFGIPLVIGFGWSNYMGNGPSQRETSANAVVATVNGDSISEAEYRNALYIEQRRSGGSTQPGPQYAQLESSSINALIGNMVLQQLANARHAHPSDADIDAEVARTKASFAAQAGKKVTDADWDQFLDQQGKSSADFREDVAKQLIGQAVMKSYMAGIKVSDAEARQQNEEVHLTAVFVQSAGGMMFGSKKPQLPEPLAEKKAQSLYDQVKAGKDIAAVAKANSDYLAQQSGDLGWRPEYKVVNAQMASMGALTFGKDFDKAVQATPPGGLTPVVKTAGFQHGFIFAKVLARRDNSPKDFDPRKVADQMRAQKAEEVLSKAIEDGVKAAKITWKDPEKQAFYDYGQWKKMENAQMMAQFGQAPEGPLPSKADVDKLKATVDTEFQHLLKDHGDDATIALIVADSLKSNPGTTPAERDQNRVKLISLYETALKSSEDQQIRFDLAGLYHENKQYDKADKQYQQIERNLGYNPPYDASSDQQALDTRQQLMAGYQTIDKTDEAAKEKEVIAKLQGQLVLDKAKEKAAQDAAAAARAVQPGGAGPTLKVGKPGGSVSAPISSLPAGGKATATLTSPGSSGKPVSAATGAAPSKSGAATSPPAGKDSITTKKAMSRRSISPDQETLWPGEMIPGLGSLQSGALYVVATPIGNIYDLSLRAISILRQVDLVVVESLGQSRRVLCAAGSSAEVLSVKSPAYIPAALAQLSDGKSVAIICDAGTPCIADPGQALVSAALLRGVPVVSIPGPNAAMAALAACGLSVQRFVFDGFPPRGRADRTAYFAELRTEPRTVVIYETHRYLRSTLQSLSNTMGQDRHAVLAHNISMPDEEIIRGSLTRLAADARLNPRRGQYVIVIGGSRQPA